MTADDPTFSIHDLKQIIFDQAAIHARLKQLGAEINAIYKGNELTVIAIINGAIVFVADLIRQLNLPLRLDCIRISSYRHNITPTQRPEIIDRIRLNIKGAHVLLIDDILDTGTTLSTVSRILEELQPASLRTCVLLDKKVRRCVDFAADFVGFEIDDAFVVGYGLDFAERYRELPCIGILHPSSHNP